MLPSTICRFEQVSLLYERPTHSSDQAKSVLASTGQSKGLRHLARAGRPHRVAQGLAHTATLLRETENDPEADQFEQDIQRALKISTISLDQVTTNPMSAQQPRDGTLPAKCNGCGAPPLPDEVEWHDAQTAECIYCGAIAETS